MHFPLITLLGLATSVFADVIDVKVGNGGLTFEPDSFSAKEGDSVRFQFFSGFGSHSVVLGSFDAPCQPASNGFFSGIISGNQAGDHTFTLNVTSTSPTWFYCSVSSHCQSGMAGVMNPSSDETIASYRNAAQNVLRQTPPGAVGGGVVATGDTGSTSGSAPSTTPSPESPRPSVTVTSEAVSSSSAVTTGAGGSTVPVSTTTSAGTGTAASGSGSSTGAAAGTTTPPSGTPASTSPSVAATTTSGGPKSEWSIVLGLAVVLGGLVALMA